MASMDQEVDVGRRLYDEGLIIEAYMDTEYSRTFMLLEATSIEDAKARFAAYPHVREGLIEFDFIEVIGMPAVAQVHESKGTALPDWWPRG